jgi:hypothetical protein
MYNCVLKVLWWTWANRLFVTSGARIPSGEFPSQGLILTGKYPKGARTEFGSRSRLKYQMDTLASVSATKKYSPSIGIVGSPSDDKFDRR